VFTEQLPSNEKRDTHTDTQTGERNLLIYAVEMGSSAMTYIPSFRHSKVDKGGFIDRQQGYLTSPLFFFFKIRKVG
jgi:hypothetical protein